MPLYDALLCHQPVWQRGPPEWFNGHFRNYLKLNSDLKKKKIAGFKRLFLLTLLVRWGFIFGWFSFDLFWGFFFFGRGLFWFGFGEGVIELFFPLLLSHRHKWLSIIKAPTEGNLC